MTLHNKLVFVDYDEIGDSFSDIGYWVRKAEYAYHDKITYIFVSRHTKLPVRIREFAEPVPFNFGKESHSPLYIAVINP